MTDRSEPGFTVLENVDAHGFRSAVREHLPDGKLMPTVSLTVRTAPLYEKNQRYIISDFDVTNSKASQQELQSDNEGRLTIRLNGGAHEIGINRRNDKPNITVSGYELSERGWATHDEDVRIKLSLLNKGTGPARNIRVSLTPIRPGVDVINGDATIPQIGSHTTASIPMVFRVKNRELEIVRLKITARDDRRNEWIDYVDIPVKRNASEIENFEIADGRILTVAKSGIDMETVKLGEGNGDGIVNPGESIVILVRDENKLWRTDVTSNDRYVDPFGVRTRKSDNWSPLDHVGASAKYDVPLIASDCPPNHGVEFFVQYWVPEYPLHHVREGIVKIKVTGEDTTSPVVENVKANGNNVLQVSLLDGSSIRKVSAILINQDNPKKSLTTVLTDDGAGGDAVAADLVFSQMIPSQVFGIFRVVIEAEDSFGNKSVYEPEERFVLH